MDGRFFCFLCGIQDSVDLCSSGNIVVLCRASSNDYFRSVRCLLAVARSVRRYNRNARVRARAKRRGRIEVCALRFIRGNAGMLCPFTCFCTRYLFGTRARDVTILIHAWVVRAINRNRNLKVNGAFTRFFSASVSMSTIRVRFFSGLAFR